MRPIVKVTATGVVFRHREDSKGAVEGQFYSLVPLCPRCRGTGNEPGVSLAMDPPWPAKCSSCQGGRETRIKIITEVFEHLETADFLAEGGDGFRWVAERIERLLDEDRSSE